MGGGRGGESDRARESQQERKRERERCALQNLLEEKRGGRALGCLFITARAAGAQVSAVHKRARGSNQEEEHSKKLDFYLPIAGRDKQHQTHTNGAAPAVSVTCLQPITASEGKTLSLVKGGRQGQGAGPSDRGGEGETGTGMGGL